MIYIHSETVNKKRGLNLKDSKEGSREDLKEEGEGRNGVIIL